MSLPLPSPLPRFDRTLLRAVERVVPAAERTEWSRTWHAELWHMHHRARLRRTHSLAAITDLSIGLTRDALWLRTESWRRSLIGTPTLCLASLLGLCLLATLITLVQESSAHNLATALRGPFQRTLFAVPLVLFVSFATTFRTHTGYSVTARPLTLLRRQLFFAAKTALLLLLSFLLSANIRHLIHATLPATSDLLQLLFFVVLALIGLRWAFLDADLRCKRCLHSLAPAARVGRLSHNLLEWSGTELVCKHGHGLLNIPEMETSWCQSSQWVDLPPNWNQPATI